MIKLTGVDPGIRDTGLVTISLDPDRKQWAVETRVWSDVTEQSKKQDVVLDPQFITELSAYAYVTQPTLSAVEGYRQRGRNQANDRKMLAMVQHCKKLMPGSVIVDNTGIKNVVTQDMLHLFQVHRFPHTNHSDLVSAARVALKVGIANPIVNKVLYKFVIDNATGADRWQQTY
jgi:hypothetical protein